MWSMDLPDHLLIFDHEGNEVVHPQNGVLPFQGRLYDVPQILREWDVDELDDFYLEIVEAYWQDMEELRLEQNKELAIERGSEVSEEEEEGNEDVRDSAAGENAAPESAMGESDNAWVEGTVRSLGNSVRSTGSPHIYTPRMDMAYCNTPSPSGSMYEYKPAGSSATPSIILETQTSRDAVLEEVGSDAYLLEEVGKAVESMLVCRPENPWTPEDLTRNVRAKYPFPKSPASYVKWLKQSGVNAVLRASGTIPRSDQWIRKLPQVFESSLIDDSAKDVWMKAVRALIAEINMNDPQIWQTRDPSNLCSEVPGLKQLLTMALEECTPTYVMNGFNVAQTKDFEAGHLLVYNPPFCVLGVEIACSGTVKNLDSTSILVIPSSLANIARDCLGVQISKVTLDLKKGSLQKNTRLSLIVAGEKTYLFLCRLLNVLPRQGKEDRGGSAHRPKRKKQKIDSKRPCWNWFPPFIFKSGQCYSILVWFQQFSVGVLNPSNTKLQRDLVHSGVFCAFRADTCDPSKENQENQKNKKTKKTGKNKMSDPKVPRLLLSWVLQSWCFFVFFCFFDFMGLEILFFFCFFGFMGLAILFFFVLVSWVLQSWYMGFIARFPWGKFVSEICNRQVGRHRCINVVNLP